MGVVRSLFGHDRVDTSDADQAAALLEARIRAARGNSKWTEIEDDLVSRGRVLVSAESDECFVSHRGVVFQTGSSNVIADQAALFYYVTQSSIVFLERAQGPRTWSEVVRRKALRGAS